MCNEIITEQLGVFNTGESSRIIRGNGEVTWEGCRTIGCLNGKRVHTSGKKKYWESLKMMRDMR
jgi:hypothetical protein